MRMLDRTDIRLLRELVHEPRSQVSQLSETLGMARNTAQARMQRLFRSGILRRSGRELDLARLEYDVVAFVTIEVTHRELDGVISALRTLEQVLEVHEISGRGDVWCRVAATDTHHLQSALRSVLRIKGVIRTETVLALHEHIPYRVEPLLDRLLAEKSQAKPSSES
nr:Lrp/AsnC family transcriptional regulator [Arthrobacter sp. Soil782]